MTEKIIRLLSVVSALLLFTESIAQQTAVTDSFKVYGNCGMCKKRIETAAQTKGVVSVAWSSETKMLKVEYDSAKISNREIQKRIVKAGHDTQDQRATDDSYNKLQACCHYERPPVLSQQVLEKTGNIKTIKFKITGMTCEEGCARGIQNALYKRKGVRSSEVNFEKGIATVVYDEAKVKKEDLIRIIEHFNADKEVNHYKAEEIK